MLYIGDASAAKAALRKAAQRGAVRRVMRGVYTDDFEADAETVVRAQFLAVVGRLLPEWHLSHSSAALLGPAGSFAFVSGKPEYARPLRLPGVTIVRLPELPQPEIDSIEAPTPTAASLSAEPEIVRVRVSSALQTIFECLSTARHYPEKNLPADRVIELIRRLGAADRARAESFARRNGLEAEYRKYVDLTVAADRGASIALARVRDFEVYYYGWRVGTLAAVGSGEFRYEYDPAWVIELSQELPLGRSPAYEGRQMPAFFENLLPEGWTESRLRSVFKLDRKDDVGLLATTQKYLSNLTIRQPAFDPSRLQFDTHSVYLDHIAPDPEAVLPVRERLGADPAARRFWIELRESGAVRVSGVQPKLPVALHLDDGIVLLLGDVETPCTHLLKFQSPMYGQLVENEWATMELARRIGLPVPSVRRVRLVGAAEGERLALLVERYDIPDQEALQKAAPDFRLSLQEDACSLLLLPRTRKYESSLERIGDRLQELGMKEPGMRLLLQHIAFSWIVGNGDLHAKNISILRRIVPGRLGIPPYMDGLYYSPLYDLVCTRLPIRDDQFALPMVGKRNNLRIRDFAALGARWGTEAEEVPALVAAIGNGIRAHLPGVLAASGLSAHDQAVYQDVVRRNLELLNV